MLSISLVPSAGSIVPNVGSIPPDRLRLLPESTPPAEESLSIIVVSDEIGSRAELAGQLRADGYEVMVTGEDGTLDETLSCRPRSLVLVDLGEDPSSALELCGDLRMRDELHLQPIVAFASRPIDEQVAVAVLLSGADDCLVVPGRTDELKARVRVQLRHRRDRELLAWAESQRKHLRDAASHDVLTGLPNRRVADAAILRGIEAGTALTILLFDVDRFKSVNDTFGHAIGDVVLRRVAKALASRARREDIVARWGGEEFIAVVRGASPEVAERIGERYRNAVRDIVFEAGIGPTRVTTSVGVATWIGEGLAPTPGQLIRAADEALYSAKHGGRDRTVCIAIGERSALESRGLPKEHET